MTGEEAINIISQMIKDEEGFLSDNTVEAHKMAIKALEQESVLDKIRAEIEQLADANGYGDYLLGYNFGLMRAVQIIDKYKAEREG